MKPDHSTQYKMVILYSYIGFFENIKTNYTVWNGDSNNIRIAIGFFENIKTYYRNSDSNNI